MTNSIDLLSIWIHKIAFTIRYYPNGFGWQHWQNWIRWRKLGRWRCALDIGPFALVFERYW